MPKTRKQKNVTKRRKDGQKASTPKRRAIIAHRSFRPNGEMMAAAAILGGMSAAFKSR